MSNAQLAVAKPSPSSGARVMPNDEATNVFAGNSDQATGHQEQPDKPFPYGLVDRTLNDPVALFTLALVVSTILLWRATMGIARDGKESGAIQAEKMERSIREAAKAAAAMEGVAQSMAINADEIVKSVEHQSVFGRVQLRAYVSVLIGEGRYQDDHYIFEARPKILNSGHTPAKNVRWRIGMAALDPASPAVFRFMLPKNVCGGSELPQHQDAFLSAVIPYRFNSETAQAIKWGFDKSLYVWGILWYDDIFGSQHHTSFAQKLWWEPDGKGDWALKGQYLPRHNRSS